MNQHYKSVDLLQKTINKKLILAKIEKNIPTEITFK